MFVTSGGNFVFGADFEKKFLVIVLKKQVFYIHHTVLLLYYTHWKCLNRRLAPETQSAYAEI